MPEKILKDDNGEWSDYDNRKKIAGDKNYFSCDEDWEVDYLADKIITIHPQRFTKDKVIQAIQGACNTDAIPSNKPRKEFVEWVMSRLNAFDL